MKEYLYNGRRVDGREISRGKAAGTGSRRLLPYDDDITPVLDKYG